MISVTFSRSPSQSIYPSAKDTPQIKNVPIAGERAERCAVGCDPGAALLLSERASPSVRVREREDKCARERERERVRCLLMFPSERPSAPPDSVSRTQPDDAQVNANWVAKCAVRSSACRCSKL